MEQLSDFSIFYLPCLIPCLIKIYSDWTLSATVGQSSETQNQVRQSLSYYMHGSHWPIGTHDSILLVAVYGLCNACMSRYSSPENPTIIENHCWKFYSRIQSETSCCHYKVREAASCKTHSLHLIKDSVKEMCGHMCEEPLKGIIPQRFWHHPQVFLKVRPKVPLEVPIKVPLKGSLKVSLDRVTRTNFS